MKNLTALGMLLAASSVAAQPQSPLRLELYGVSNSQGDLQGPGKLEEQQIGGSLDYLQPIGRGRMAGFGIEVDHRWFDFSSLSGANNQLAGLDLRQRYQVSGVYIQPLAKDWGVMVSPSLNWSFADGADAGDGFGYSLVAIASYRGFEDLKLGFGAAYVNGITEVSTVPFLTIDWQINDKWRLSNPFDAGFNGQAGLELSYQHSPNITLGAGGGYRSDQFAYGDFKVKQDLPLTYLRGSYQMSPKTLITLVTGYRLAGDLTLRDHAGERDIEVEGRWMMGALFNVAF